MFDDLSDLRDSLLVARLLREEILAAPALPEASARLREEFLAANSSTHGSRRAVEAATSRGRARDFSLVDEDALTELAAAAGSGERRTHAGAPFHGKAAPAPSRIPELTAELIETINSPVAIETWSPPVRAF